MVEPYPSEKWWTSSVGMMKFPTEWKNKIHVPNHQPVMEVNQQWLGWLPFGNLFHSFGSHGPFTSMNYSKWWFLLCLPEGFRRILITDHQRQIWTVYPWGVLPLGEWSNRYDICGIGIGGIFGFVKKSGAKSWTLNGKNNDKPEDPGASLIFGQVRARVCVWIWWTKTVIGQKMVETQKKIGSFKNNITGINSELDCHTKQE